MSNSSSFVTEPPTNGLVRLTIKYAGKMEIDVELWSKESPKACRNFVQLCLEGYYNNSPFHRIIKDFMIQGGDPSGTGEGGVSIYGDAFPVEVNPRLQFRRRGLLAMASSEEGGKHLNQSQFFFTLGRCEWLNRQHTIFGTVKQESMYHLVKLGDVAVDANDRPEVLPLILQTEVVENPFPDIIPRGVPAELKAEDKSTSRKRKRDRVAKKEFSLLSFGDEAETDEIALFTKGSKEKIQSSHDVLTEDPRLRKQQKPPKEESKEPKLDVPQQIPVVRSADADEADQVERRDAAIVPGEGERQETAIKENATSSTSRERPAQNDDGEPRSHSQTQASSLLASMRSKYAKRSSKTAKSRENETLKKLGSFSKKLEHNASSADDNEWLGHELTFEKLAKVHDANMRNHDDDYRIEDPLKGKGARGSNLTPHEIRRLKEEVMSHRSSWNAGDRIMD